MPDYGVTEKGFVIKRLDTILEEVHGDLTEGFGFDTGMSPTASFLNVLVTTFCGQIADLWEVAQDNYYSKYPSTATGVNLDNAVQYGGIKRAPSKKTCYPLHCTGDDGTDVPEDAQVATSTSPKVTLTVGNEFQISRNNCNSVRVIVASFDEGSVYTVTINGIQYKYHGKAESEFDVLEGISSQMEGSPYHAIVDAEGKCMDIEDSLKYRNNNVELSSNLTTEHVTTIANFYTDEYGKIIIPYNIITEKVNNIGGFESVTNILEPTYGRIQESDTELRQSYIAKSALRSNTMIESIVAELINNVSNVDSASGYENFTDETNEAGMPPHSIEIIVDGGDEVEIATAILNRKAGGIQTHGDIVVDVPGSYGDSIPIRFNRPERLYTWLKVVLHGKSSELPVDYAPLVIASLLEDGTRLSAGSSLYTQLLNDGIYSAVSGITYIDIYSAHSTDQSYIPGEADYKQGNVIVTMRQKILLDEKRIEVGLDEDA